jgi:hypothetical protein
LKSNDCFVFPPRDSNGSVCAARIFAGERSRKTACVYVPLVSLRINEGQAIGDFDTLVALAKWAKRAGIGQIDVHLERLRGQLLDPVHAVVVLDSPPGDPTLQSVRSAKLAALWKNYEREPRPAGLDEFGEMFPWIKCDPFGQWVQFLLFRQLSAAFVRVADTGVDLILDYYFFNGPELSDQEDPLRVTSYFANAVRLVGFDLRPPPECLEFLRKVRPLVPSALIADPALTALSDTGRLVEMAVVPSTTGAGPIDGRFHVLPVHLSPEMISEFPESRTVDEVQRAVRERVVTGALSVTFYLADLLGVAYGGDGRKRPRPIQSIEGHRRFAFPYLLEQMEDAVGPIAEFLEGRAFSEPDSR